MTGLVVLEMKRIKFLLRAYSDNPLFLLFNSET